MLPVAACVCVCACVWRRGSALGRAGRARGVRREPSEVDLRLTARQPSGSRAATPAGALCFPPPLLPAAV